MAATFLSQYRSIRFLKLLAYLLIVFLQDSVLFRQKYPQHPFWNHRLFLLPAYGNFAKDFLAHLDHKKIDQNSLIRTALPNFGQQAGGRFTYKPWKLDDCRLLEAERIILLSRRQAQWFLTGKVTFTLTPTKIRLQPQSKSPLPLNTLDAILHLPMANVPSFFFTAIDNCLSPFGSSGLAALTPVLDGWSASSVQ